MSSGSEVTHRLGGDPSDPDAFEVRLMDADDEAIVAVRGDIDMSTADKVWSCLEVAIGRGVPVVLDLQHTTFMDSTGLSAVVRATRATGQERAIVLRSPRPIVRRVLELSGLDQVVTIED